MFENVAKGKRKGRKTKKYKYTGTKKYKKNINNKLITKRRKY
jgi:hypothetical protein